MLIEYLSKAIFKLFSGGSKKVHRPFTVQQTKFVFMNIYSLYVHEIGLMNIYRMYLINKISNGKHLSYNVYLLNVCKY